jgi:KilA-N domain
MLSTLIDYESNSNFYSPEDKGMQLTYNEHQIDQRDDNYVNLTQIAKANKVRLNAYFQSAETQRYLKAAVESQRHESCQRELVEVVSTNRNKATWGHPLVALHFGQWISPEFYVWCNQNIYTLMTTGTTSINDNHNDRINQLQNQLSQLTGLVTNVALSVAGLVEHNHKPLPKASVDPVPGEIQALTERQCITRLIRNYVHRKNTTELGQRKTEQEVTQWMYRELKYRHNFDAYARLKNCKGKYKSKIDLIEAEGYLPQLHAICNHFLGN